MFVVQGIGNVISVCVDLNKILLSVVLVYEKVAPSAIARTRQRLGQQRVLPAALGHHQRGAAPGRPRLHVSRLAINKALCMGCVETQSATAPALATKTIPLDAHRAGAERARAQLRSHRGYTPDSWFRGKLHLVAICSHVRRARPRPSGSGGGAHGGAAVRVVQDRAVPRHHGQRVVRGARGSSRTRRCSRHRGRGPGAACVVRGFFGLRARGTQKGTQLAWRELRRSTWHSCCAARARSADALGRSVCGGKQGRRGRRLRLQQLVFTVPPAWLGHDGQAVRARRRLTRGARVVAASKRCSAVSLPLCLFEVEDGLQRKIVAA